MIGTVPGGVVSEATVSTLVTPRATQETERSTVSRNLRVLADEFGLPNLGFSAICEAAKATGHEITSSDDIAFLLRSCASPYPALYYQLRDYDGYLRESILLLPGPVTVQSIRQSTEPTFPRLYMVRIGCRGEERNLGPIEEVRSITDREVLRRYYDFLQSGVSGDRDEMLSLFDLSTMRDRATPGTGHDDQLMPREMLLALKEARGEQVFVNRELYESRHFPLAA